MIVLIVQIFFTTICHLLIIFILFLLVTDGVHQTVPADVKAAAEQFAKDALKESDSEDD